MGLKVIINADDFGMSETVNKAIIEGLEKGILEETCIMSNLPGFESAANYLNQNPQIPFGIHLNLTEGKTLDKNPVCNSLIYDKQGFFNNKFIGLLLKSFNFEFLAET